MADWITKRGVDLIFLAEVMYIGVCGSADYKSTFMYSKFEMVDPIWRMDKIIDSIFVAEITCILVLVFVVYESDPSRLQFKIENLMCFQFCW